MMRETVFVSVVRLYEVEVAIHAGRAEIRDGALVDAMGAAMMRLSRPAEIPR